MLRRILGNNYTIDPQTKVEVWSMCSFEISEEAARGNRTLDSVTTWSSFPFKKIFFPTQDFGPDDIIVVCTCHTGSNAEPIIIATSKEEFESRFASVPVRSSEERDAWFDRLIQQQDVNIARLDALMSDLQSLQARLNQFIIAHK